VAPAEFLRHCFQFLLETSTREQRFKPLIDDCRTEQFHFRDVEGACDRKTVIAKPSKELHAASDIPDADNPTSQASRLQVCNRDSRVTTGRELENYGLPSQQRRPAGSVQSKDAKRAKLGKLD
jgi:hypothetical protein